MPLSALEAAKQRLAAAEEQRTHDQLSLTGYGLSTSGKEYSDALANLNAVARQSRGAGGGVDPAEENRRKALALTEGRGDATMNDPRVTAALDMIQKQMGTGPYSAQVVNQQANRMADRTATAAGATAAQLREQLAARGGDPNDPSFQAALRAADTGRQQQNNADRGDLESTATLQNYGAQNAAANQLANQRLGQLGQANTQYNQAANLYANEQYSGGHQNTYGNTGGTTAYGTARQSHSQPLGYTPPTYGNGGQTFTYTGDQGNKPNVPMTSNGMPIQQPQASPGAGVITNWNDQGADHTQYANPGDPSLTEAQRAERAKRTKSPFVYKPQY